jgi:membrane associated rhomboid family serine protease
LTGLAFGASFLRPSKLAFARDALMPFVGALDAIFRFAGAWKLFDHFENTTWRIPTYCRPDGNNISDLKFMGRHRFLALPRGG